MKLITASVLAWIWLGCGLVLAGEDGPPPHAKGKEDRQRQQASQTQDDPLFGSDDKPGRGPKGKGMGREDGEWRGRGPHGERGRRGGPSSRPDGEGLLSASEIEQVMEFVKAKFPELHGKMVRGRQRDRVGFYRMFRRVGPPLLDIYRTQQRDPDLADKMIASFKTEMDIDTLRQEYRAAVSDADRDRIRGQLREKLSVRFDQRMERLALEIKRLENRLNDAKDRLAAQQQAKDTLIDDELSRQVLDLGSWGAGDDEKY